MDITRISINNNCCYHYGDCEEAWYKGYDDSSWEKVILPHDYSVAAPFSKEYSSGTGYVRGGIAWYRIYVRIPEELRGKRLTLVFDGIYNNSYVWVNSYFLGKRPYGYSEILYDISEQASFGDDLTEISVKVAHTDIADSRWFTGSGITRKAYIIASEKVTTALHGVFFTTESVEEKNGTTVAKISVRNEIVGTHELYNIPVFGASYHADKNYTVVSADSDNSASDNSSKVKVLSTSGEITVENTLIDAQGRRVLTLQGELAYGTDIAPDSRWNKSHNPSLTLTGELTSPELWSPEQPSLYTLETRLTLNGEKYLTDSQNVGIRTFFFNPDKGFFLNGVSTKFKGVCLHHDGGCLGAAMKKEVWLRRLELLKKSGCNAIRCSHNPHMPELYDLCDEMGFLMMDEAFDEWENPKNKWSTGHNVYPPRHQGYFEDFPMWHEKDLRAMVKRDRNHPSIVLYSVGNEIDYPNDPYCHPLFTEMTGNNDTNKPAKERQYDKNKPNMERLSVLVKELVSIVKDEDNTRPVTVAAAFPELSADIGFIDELEVVGYNYKEHLYEKDHKRFPDKTFLGSENGHSVEAWNAVKDNDYICGQFLWTGIDYLGEAHGWPIHGAGAGFITSAGFPKEEFNERARLWDGSGVEETRVDKADSARTEESGHGIITVETWTPSEQYRGFSGDEKELGYLYQILVRVPHTGPEKMSWNGMYRDGEENSFTEKKVTAQVTGAGVLAGLDNGDMSDLTPYTANTKDTFNGNLVVYVRRIAEGDIEVRIAVGGDEAVSVEMPIVTL